MLTPAVVGPVKTSAHASLQMTKLKTIQPENNPANSLVEKSNSLKPRCFHLLFDAKNKKTQCFYLLPEGGAAYGISAVQQTRKSMKS